MKNITRHTGKLEVIEKLKNSINGNARYKIRVDGWTCVTKPNSMTANYVENYRDRIVIAEIGTHRNQATLNTIELA